jgi:hypothetical protein
VQPELGPSISALRLYSNASAPKQKDYEKSIIKLDSSVKTVCTIFSMLCRGINYVLYRGITYAL